MPVSSGASRDPDLARADHAERQPRGQEPHLLELAGVLAREQQVRHPRGMIRYCRDLTGADGE